MYRNSFFSDMRDLIRYRSLLRNLLYKDLKVKYRGSTIGLLWSLLNPLVLIVVYSIVLRWVMRVEVENLPLLVITGVVPWISVSATLINATESILANGELVKKIHFPLEILPISTVCFNMTQFLVALIVFLPAVLYYKGSLPVTLLLYPIAIALLAAFLLGAALFLSAITTFFKDVRYLTEVSMLVVFWATPIVYPYSVLPDWLLWANPLGSFFSALQEVVYFERAFTLAQILGMAGWGLASLTVGAITFRQTNRRFAEEL